MGQGQKEEKRKGQKEKKGRKEGKREEKGVGGEGGEGRGRKIKREGGGFREVEERVY